VRAVVVLAVLASGAWSAAPAGATPSVSLSVDRVPVARGGFAPVTVHWSGQRPGTLILIRICATSIASPTFDEALDCSLLSEITPNGTADGAGSATVQVFRGPEPGGDDAWGCFAAGDVAPPGIRPATTCYVRVTNDVVSNMDDDAEAPFTIVPAPGASGSSPSASDAGGGAPGAQVAGATAVPASIGLTG
jgi:hypothetical protein